MRAPTRGGGGSSLQAQASAPSWDRYLLLLLPLLVWRGRHEPQLPVARSRRNRQEQLIEEPRECPRVRAAPPRASNCEARALSAGQRTAVPGEPGVEREAPLCELSRQDKLECASRCGSGTADSVDGHAQTLRSDRERKQRIELIEPRPQLLLTCAKGKKDGVRRDDRFTMDAARGACIVSRGQQEADVSDDQRVQRSEGAKSCRNRPGTSEFADRLLRLRWAE